MCSGGRAMRIAITSSAGTPASTGGLPAPDPLHRAPTSPACATDTALYLHPLLEESPDPATVSADVRRELDDLVSRARAACAACPLFAECLYAAVVQRDVAGFVGCTTQGERDAIRDRLGAGPEREDLDAAAGVRGERRPLDHEAVLAARAAYPDDSLEMLAHRLECSLSTVKRHLRRARREAAGTGAAAADRPEPKSAGVPTVDQVLDAFDDVVETGG